MRESQKKLLVGAALLAVVAAVAAYAFLSSPRGQSITLASTTSTENSGLLGYVLPIFKDESGIGVRVVAVGTGQAMRMAMKGDADVILVHHRPSEEEFVKDGYGVERIAVMHNDFVIVGPAADPAGIKGMTDVAAALGRIRSSRALFVSRGDDSGTHKRELSLWAALGFKPGDDDGDWYRQSGSGQGATLNVASEMDAYCLSDRASWVRAARRGGSAAIEPVFGDSGRPTEVSAYQGDGRSAVHRLVGLRARPATDCRVPGGRSAAVFS
jgi:tungstate transport system substrate-binding protein